ncbi:LysE/ArgO family amino acid transporter [Thalassotalea sp. Y01]|uniref:LysE/ArgO family amino acid transporter n=1 Tax=Thalassotalea sp. Y01 TaxID=2729613 RepID=UPI00145D4C39|nr:LysE/ArgO family amino acid transporter [Thalassotalea sp. Y01]NMP17321.1 amino acid transporter [Thalassotalea sp. Y01]
MMTFVSGFLLGLSLILAIGAQNAFVLKQGIKKHHVFLVCAICAVSDAFLIVLGVGGFGIIVEKYPQLEVWARYGGAAFVFVYGILSFYSAFTKNHALQAAGSDISSAFKTASICLAFTWLNPHVYLDTLVLLGSISSQYPGEEFTFGFGAVLASFVFFFSLGYGARFLAPIFARAKAWKVLEFVVGLIMMASAASLIFSS